MNWRKGRQGDGYEKLKIFHLPFLDCWLIRYNKGFKLPIHSDGVEGKRHYRLNILIKGEDAYIGNSIFRWWRVVLFRADMPHGTRELTRNRLIFSLGWAIKEE